MTFQGGDGVRATSPVVQGGTIEVEVGPNDTTVEVSSGTQAGTKVYTVTPGKTVSIPVPPVPGGTIVSVSVGTGARARVVLVEVIALMR